MTFRLKSKRLSAKCIKRKKSSRRSHLILVNRLIHQTDCKVIQINTQHLYLLALLQIFPYTVENLSRHSLPSKQSVQTNEHAITWCLDSRCKENTRQPNITSKHQFCKPHSLYLKWVKDHARVYFKWSKQRMGNSLCH